MKNAYELAENILKSKPDKNIELKSSDSFASIELYGTSACKRKSVWIEQTCKTAESICGVETEYTRKKIETPRLDKFL